MSLVNFVRFTALFLLGAALAAACSSSSGSDGGEPSGSGAGGGASVEVACPETGEEFETARLYIEHNATDEDTGVHGLFGAEGWRSLCLTGPDGVQVLVVEPRGALGELGLADLFFESREPENDEYSIAELRDDFPEGRYRVAGIDVEGTARVGTALFSHAIPVEPEITAPRLAEEPEEAGEEATVAAAGLVVRWEPVEEDLDGEPVEVTAYEVIVTKEEHDDPDGLSRPVYDVHVPPNVTALAVPEAFLEPGTVYELEVIVIESSGNQTIGLGFFATE